MQVDCAILGLGNPGNRYALNRHSIGLRVVDALAGKMDVQFRYEKKILADCAYAQYNCEQKDQPRPLSALAEARCTNLLRLILAKSLVYMNTSHQVAVPLLRTFKLPISRLIVIHDELELPFGTIRTKIGGGHAGHNGLRGISNFCGPEYARVRFGIGRPQGGESVSDFVLQNFSEDEEMQLPNLINSACGAVLHLVDETCA